MNGNIFFLPSLRGGFWGIVAGILLLALTQSPVQAQEALRGSLAEDTTAATLQQDQTTIGYYNLLLGPTAWRFASALNLTYNDNVNYEASGSESDFIIAPSVNTQMHWPVSLKNSLDVSVNVGYSEYVVHSSLSQFFITPGSGVSFDVYADKIKINFHDQVTVSKYAYQNPGVAGNNQNLVSLQNVAGVSALMGLEKGEVTVGYDHDNYASLSGGQTQPANGSDNIFANAGYNVLANLLAGVELGGSLINGGQGSVSNTTPSAVQYSAGVFGSSQITEYMNVGVHVGYTIWNNDSNSGTNVTTTGSGFYFSASLSHRVNQFFSYSLSAGRSTDLSGFGQPQNQYYVQLSPVWNVSEKYTIGTSLSWRQGSEVDVVRGTQNNGDYDQYGLGLSVSRTLTRKLTGSLSYQFVKETSSGGAAAYSDDIISLSFSYQF